MRESFPVTMLLHLIRHGHALPANKDSDRPLSPQGRDEVVRLAERLRADPAHAPGIIWHSSFRRARETAALLARHAGRAVTLVGKSHLTPEADPEKIAHLLVGLPSDMRLAIVGHEPHLGTLATLLVTGAMDPVRFGLEKAEDLILTSAAGLHGASGLPRWELWPESPPSG